MSRILRARRSTSDSVIRPLLEEQHPSLEKAIAADLRRLLADYATLPVKEIVRLGNHYTTQEPPPTHRPRPDRRPDCHRASRGDPSLFTCTPSASTVHQLVGDYGRIGARAWKPRQVKAYMRRLQAFEDCGRTRILTAWVSRTRRALAFWRSLRRSVEPVRSRVSNRRRSDSMGKRNERAEDDGCLWSQSCGVF